MARHSILVLLPIVSPVLSLNARNLKYCKWFSGYCYCSNNPLETRVPYAQRDQLFCGAKVPENCLAWQMNDENECQICWNTTKINHIKIPTQIQHLTKTQTINNIQCLKSTCSSRKTNHCLEFSSPKSAYLSNSRRPTNSLDSPRNSYFSVSRLSDYVRRLVLNSALIPHPDPPRSYFWNPWSSWSTCGSNCHGAVTKQRFRSCKSNRFCEGQPFEVATCENQPHDCPYWSGWASWSETSCGKSRRRNCEKVSEFRGIEKAECIGNVVETVGCWSGWSDCDFENSCRRSKSRDNVGVLETEFSDCFEGNGFADIEKSVKNLQTTAARTGAYR